MSDTKELGRDLAVAIDPKLLSKTMEQIISDLLNRSGIYYRCFSRVKSEKSISEKFKRKQYSCEHRMQDIYGIRIVLYYRDDIDIVLNQIKNRFDCIEIVRDENDVKEFKPERLNIVCRFPDGVDGIVDMGFFDRYCIDKTFEIQIRTVFSEGWHEVEHDMRYKCLDSWESYDEYSRVLNGIFATLNTCDWSIIQLFDSLAYSNYKNKEWEDLIRNKFRIRMKQNELSDDIRRILEKDHKLAKLVYRYDRNKIIEKLNNSKIVIPINADNIVKMINIDINGNKELLSNTEAILIECMREEELIP